LRQQRYCVSPPSRPRIGGAEHAEAAASDLCSSKDEEQIELLQLNQGEIRVAEYLTALPAMSILAAKLHDAVIRVREQLIMRESRPDEE
jgi:hypothetical protein